MTKLQCLLFFAFSALLMWASTPVHADIYRCRDKTGQIITSDRVIPECSDKVTQVYTSNGVLKEQFNGTLTPEQKRMADLEKQQRLKEAKIEEDNKKQLRYLTAHYPTEADIEIARQKALNALNEKIITEQKLIETNTKALKVLQQEQARWSKAQANHFMDGQLKEDGLRQTILQSNRAIQRYMTQKDDINRQFDDTHKRYLEIVVSNKN